MTFEHPELRLIRPSDLSPETLQTAGMWRTAAVSGPTTGSSGLFMGTTEMAPRTVSGAHHHGASETAIYVAAGAPVFVFRRGDELVRLVAQVGDFVYVPAYTPHVEENPGEEPALVVIARTSDEAIVENLDTL